MINDISVIIPTFNRAEALSRTLRGMVAADKGGMSVEFLIVDNASTDKTKSVVQSFSEAINVRYLYEREPGKNRALNRAIQCTDLGNIVVFTDDDVDPSPNWLTAIAETCRRWKNHSVFGGRINVIFPYEDIPHWAVDEYILPLAFAYHNYSDRECVYEGLEHPFGPNYWVRKEVFRDGRLFNEAIGPHPNNQILGDETKFLLELKREGYEIVYCPTAVVGHRIKGEVLTVSGIFRRAYQHGRGGPYIWGLQRSGLLRKSRTCWRIRGTIAILRHAVMLFLGGIFSRRQRRTVNIVKRIVALAYHVEAMRLVTGNRKLMDGKQESLRSAKWSAKGSSLPGKR